MFEFCMYEDFYNYIYGKKIYISKVIIKDMGRREWYDLLHEFVGVLVIDRRSGIAVDSLYMELIELFPWIFTEDEITEQDQLEKILSTYRQARREKRIAKSRNDKRG